ncbi:MAG: penicillin acylase family protein [Bacteroidota bacterium]
MSKKKKIVIGTAVTLPVIIVAVILFLRYQLTKSFPETTGVVSVDGLSAPVQIYRDRLGVPHIFAENDEDLMFGVGYVHAQDRLWQMELSRRAGEGRLSEAFGARTLDFDRMFRTIGFQRLAQRLEKSLHPESHRLLAAYARGVNSFISNQKGKLPVEFDILGITPEPWTVEDCLIIVRLMAWELNMSWWINLTLADLANKLGDEKAKEIFPTYPENRPIILPAPPGKKYPFASTNLREIDLAYREFIGIEGTGVGSNSWTIDGTKSITGKPLLANDPHLTLTAPSRWYEIHLSGGGFDVAGVTIPGVPGIVIGRNKHIAWGLTNGMIDDADFYIEKMDSLHPNQYFFDGQWQELRVWQEEIPVRGKSPDTLTIRETHRGPIVSDIHSYPLFEYQMYKTGFEKDFPLSFHWTGFEISDEAQAILLINKAKNWEEFEEGLREFTVPGQNFVYADDHGNIGYWLVARVPMRKRQKLATPSPGWTNEYDWTGFIPFEKLPHVYNPSEHWIATANNKIVDDSYPYYLTNLWEPPSRIIRIEELLKRKEPFSAEDFESMQKDVVSPHARELVPYILHAFETTDSLGAARSDGSWTSRPGVSPADEQVRTALTYLRNWDYAFRKEDVATTIFNVFFVKLLYNTYHDEMGDELFNNYLLLANVPYRVTSKLLQDSTSVWFDDVGTPERETRDDIIRKSFLDAIIELRTRLGGELKTWQWGKLHELTSEHILGRIPGMGRVFNIGPFQTGGAGTTINSGEYNLTRPYKQLVGPSMRQIADLSDSTSLMIIITSGESGQPLHPHYDDQAHMWLNGEYHHLSMDRSEIERAGWDLLTLRPAQTQ